MNVKYTFFFAIMYFFLSNAYTQPNYAIDKGSLKLGGGLNFSSMGSDDFEGRQTAFSIFPSAQVFILPGLAAGGTIGISTVSGLGETQTTAGIGPEISYYFGNEDSKIFPFISGSYLFYDRLDDSDFTNQVSTLSGGAAYMVSKNVAINGELFFRLSNVKFNSISSNNDSFGLLVGIDVFIFGKVRD